MTVRLHEQTRWHIKIICILLITSFITYIFGNLHNHQNHISKILRQNTQITAYTLRGRAIGRNIRGMLKTFVGWTFWRFFFFFFWLISRFIWHGFCIRYCGCLLLLTTRIMGICLALQSNICYKWRLLSLLSSGASLF